MTSRERNPAANRWVSSIWPPLATRRTIPHSPSIDLGTETVGVAPGMACWGGSPADMIRAWPTEERLGVVYRAGSGAVSGRTIVTRPDAPVVFGPRGLETSRDDRSGAASAGPSATACDSSPTSPLPCPLDAIARTWRSTRAPSGAGQDTSEAGAIGGWLSALSYDLGRLIEPAADTRRAGTGGAKNVGVWPTAVLQRFEGAHVFDHARGTWSTHGIAASLPELAALTAAAVCREPCRAPCRELCRVTLRSPSESDRRRYEQRVARAIEYIRSGDVFQVNLAHVLTGTFTCARRELAAALLERSGAWHGAYMELDDRRAVLSLSPELFVDVRSATGRAVMRPMKGTRPGSAEPAELARSPKDRAELAMIIDLVRNDLGRVAEFGSVRVEAPLSIERHGGEGGGVWQGVATIGATLRAGLDAADVVRAAFPSGSVTGAPKVRAMQIIDELEDFTRGFYCGSIGVAHDDGGLSLSVAIRTAMIEDDRVTFPVGAGIVADSVPGAEWLETLAKAGVLRG